MKSYKIKKLTKMMLTLVLTLSMILGVIPVSDMTEVYAASSGTCGENLTWTLDDEGVLTISGTGDMMNYDDSGNEAPWNSYAIKQIVIDEGVTSIGDRAFSECENLTSIVIPDSVTSIGKWSFSACENLTSIILPDSVDTIGEYTFSYCENLTSITIPSGVKELKDSLFSECSSLETIIIPEGIEEIGVGVFYQNNSLEKITLPSGLRVIGRYAFNSCSSLTEIVIPSSVTSIGEYALNNCNLLANVYYSGTEDDWLMINIGSYNSGLDNANIHYMGAPVVSVNSISISPTSLALKVGEIGNLTTTVSPENATNKSVTWKSSDPEVTTVADGKVTAVAPGKAVITVKSVDGGKSASCNVVVSEKEVIRLTGIVFDKTEATLTEGDKLTLVVSFTPADAANKSLTWSSSDEIVAKVADGEVSAIKAGKAVIKAVAEDGDFEAKCEITVKEKEETPTEQESPLGPDKPDLSQYTASANEIAVKSINLKKTVFSDVKGIKKFEVTSGDATSVKIKGSTLTVLQSGTVTIAAKNKAGEKLAEKTVKVVLPVAKTTETTEINRRGNLDMNKYITSIVKPSKWKSSSKKIAEVSQDGLLTIKKSGKVKITVTFPAEKGMKAKTLTIKLNIKMPQFKKTTYTVKVGKFVQTAVKNADTAGITYKTENTAIATVDASGKVTGVSKGTTKLIMTVKGIDYETKIKVK